MFFRLLCPVFFVRCVSLQLSQGSNKNISVAVTCHLVACALHNPELTTLTLDHSPSACVAHDAWRSEALPVPPAEVAGEEWTAMLKFLREVSAYSAFCDSICRCVPFVLHLPFALPGRPQQTRASDVCRACRHTGLQCTVGPSAYAVCCLKRRRQACR